MQVQHAAQGKEHKKGGGEKISIAENSLAQKFGLDSLAMRKPSVVEEYMAAHNLRTLLTTELAAFFKEKYFPTNPFPHLYFSLRQKYTIQSEYARLTDDRIKQMLDDRAEVVFQGARDSEGRKLPVCAVTVKGHLPGTGGPYAIGARGMDTGIESVTIYGETPTLLTTDHVMMQRLSKRALRILMTPLLHTHTPHRRTHRRIDRGQEWEGPRKNGSSFTVYT